jgi:hypothetical protein
MEAALVVLLLVMCFLFDLKVVLFFGALCFLPQLAVYFFSMWTYWAVPHLQVLRQEHPGLHLLGTGVFIWVVAPVVSVYAVQTVPLWVRRKREQRRSHRG